MSRDQSRDSAQPKRGERGPPEIDRAGRKNRFIKGPPDGGGEHEPSIALKSFLELLDEQLPSIRQKTRYLD